MTGAAGGRPDIRPAAEMAEAGRPGRRCRAGTGGERRHGAFIGDLENYAELNAALDELAARYGVTPPGIAVAWINRHPANMQVVFGTYQPWSSGRVGGGLGIAVDP
ncbi:hypothetical protein [Streptomyces sp. NPDC047841]|uniref:hypothetical protein n=1 Tax=Streptomyces sp. NPDC047841 TaxID=3154708 RepID=UPI0034563C57